MPDHHLNSDWNHRLLTLDRGLLALAHLWRPQPFKGRPDWCAAYPELTQAVLALSDEQLASLLADGMLAADWLCSQLPTAEAEQLRAMQQAARLAQVQAAAPNEDCTSDSPHWQWDVPGRKWAQITAFADALDAVRAPLLEWCAGKGHLGRLLAARSGAEVLSLERDAALCEHGRSLATRSRVAQRFEVLDVLTPLARGHLAGRHALALHACGELHRHLLRESIAAGVAALDVAPCCYHLGAGEVYRAWCDGPQLPLTRDDLRLAVTQTTTASGRERRKRDQEMAWKLGFAALRRRSTGDDGYQPIRPIDKAWLTLDYEGFCTQLAVREGLSLTGLGAIDWARCEAEAWQAQREVMRLGVVRAAFARFIEMWLVLDMGCYLQQHGYQLTLRLFCAPELTPRNILLSARRDT